MMNVIDVVIVDGVGSDVKSESRYKCSVSVVDDKCEVVDGVGSYIYQKYMLVQV